MIYKIRYNRANNCFLGSYADHSFLYVWFNFSTDLRAVSHICEGSCSETHTNVQEKCAESLETVVGEQVFRTSCESTKVLAAVAQMRMIQ